MFYLFLLFVFFAYSLSRFSVLCCLKVLESLEPRVRVYKPQSFYTSEKLHDFPYTTSKPLFTAPKYRLWANPNIKTGFQTP